MMNPKTILNIFLAMAMTCIAAEPTISRAESRLLAQLEDLPTQQAMQKLKEEITPDSSPALRFTLALKLHDMKQTDQAIQQLQLALEQQPDFHRARHLLAQLLAHQKQFADCATHLTRLLQEPDAPRTHQMWALLATAYAQDGKLLPAENAIRQAIALDPENLPYQRWMLHILRQQNMLRQAASLAQQLLPKMPQDELLWLAILDPMLQDGNLQKASECLTVACATVPESHRLLAIQAEVLLQLKLYQPAATCLKKLGQKQPIPVRLALYATQAFVYAKHQRLAQDCLMTIHPETLTPAQSLLYHKLKLKLNPGKDAADRLKQWQYILSLEPLDAEALLETARLLKTLKHTELADQTLDKLLRIAPDSMEAWLLKAELAWEKHNRQKAIRCLNKAYQIYPSQELGKTIESLRKTD